MEVHGKLSLQLKGGVIMPDLVFELTKQIKHRQEYIILKIADPDGSNSIMCKWEHDANPYQIAHALECLAARLKAGSALDQVTIEDKKE